MSSTVERRDVFINGRFLVQPLSGMQRYAEELVGALDAKLAGDPALAARWRFTVLVPRGDRRASRIWRHVTVREIGRLKGHAWEQLDLARAARSGTLVSLGGTGPVLHRRQIVAMHDANVFAHPEAFAGAYGRFHRALRPVLARRARRLITISRFSAAELGRHCRIAETAFTIIHDSAEHILAVHPAPKILARNGLQPGQYLLCVGNLSPNKNLKAAVAALPHIRHDSLQMAIAGGGVAAVFGSVAAVSGQRIRLLGRVTDGELRALYEHAAAFIFPSIYEGFGVPPLEAMALGCPVIASSTTAMPEILGEAPMYFDPVDPEMLAARVNALLDDPAARTRQIAAGFRQAKIYSWATGAQTLLTLIAET